MMPPALHCSVRLDTHESGTASRRADDFRCQTDDANHSAILGSTFRKIVYEELISGRFLSVEIIATDKFIILIAVMFVPFILNNKCLLYTTICTNK